MINVKSNGIIKSLPEMKDLCNPNLLDNSDFKSGIINQRGKTTYGLVLNWTGSIDRWIYFSYGPITVGEGYIQVGPSASNQTTYFKQRLYKIINEELTCAVQVKSLTGTCKMNFSKTFVDKEIHEGLNIINIPANQNVDTVQFNLEGANSQIQIEFIKLEKGSIFTGMPQWDFATELLKCKRYYKQYYRYPIRPVSSGTRTYLLPITFDVEMAKIPSMICNEILNSSAAATGAHLSEFVASVYNITNVVFDKNIGDYGFLTLALDAEMY